jgi:hypothetical protein
MWIIVNKCVLMHVDCQKESSTVMIKTIGKGKKQKGLNKLLNWW